MTTRSVVMPNIPNTSTWRLIWSLTRAMKNAGWRHLASSNGTAKSSDEQDDKWGATFDSMVASGASMSLSGVVNGLATAVGLTGLTSADAGRFLLYDDGPDQATRLLQIVEVLSDTSCTARSIFPDGVPVVGGVEGPWEIHDATAQSWTTYGNALNSVACWWVGEGPAVLKIPFTAAPVAGALPEFVRGENIKQPATGFEGELISWTWDGVSSGWLVVAPRVRGSGALRYGLTSTPGAGPPDLVGDWSGVTITGTAIGTVIEYREQVVFWKQNNTTQGTILAGYFDVVGDNAERYSTLTAAAGCTATVAPGGGGTGNTFPTHGYVIRGNGSSGTHIVWFGSDYLTQGNGLVIAMEAIEAANRSADGTWTTAYANLYGTTYNPGECDWISFQRLNDTEEGDVYPFIYFVPNNAYELYTNIAANRTYSINSDSLAQSSSFYTQQWTSEYYVPFRGWFKRGLPDESYTDFENAMVRRIRGGTSNAQTLMCLGGRVPETVSCAARVVRVREPIWVVSAYIWRKCRKGTLRWAFFVQGGQRFALSDSKRWIQFGNGMNYYSDDNNSYPTIIHGGWDGTTVQTAM